MLAGEIESRIIAERGSIRGQTVGFTQLFTGVLTYKDINLYVA